MRTPPNNGQRQSPDPEKETRVLEQDQDQEREEDNCEEKGSRQKEVECLSWGVGRMGEKEAWQKGKIPTWRVHERCV